MLSTRVLSQFCRCKLQDVPMDPFKYPNPCVCAIAGGPLSVAERKRFFLSASNRQKFTFDTDKVCFDAAVFRASSVVPKVLYFTCGVTLTDHIFC